MNCREFRRNHDAFVDDTLSGRDVEAMALHTRFCGSCAHLDTRVRRALLVAHNLPRIHPSASFNDRLQARLAQERALMGTRGGAELDIGGTRWRPFSAGSYAAVTAGLLLAAGLALTATVLGGDRGPIRLDPVVASLPEPEPSILATPAMVASMPTGMGVWPAVFVAQQAPWHFASDAVGR
jgi:hypothetical protein